MQTQLETLFVLDPAGCIRSTREPQAKPGPKFILIRNTVGCLWAVRADLPAETARELDKLARQEPPLIDFRAAPRHAGRYQALLGGRGRAGPAFRFPTALAMPEAVVRIEDERPLARHFSGWVPGEIAAGREPVMAVLDQGSPVSLCCCARRSTQAAEAGVETAAGYRRRGFGARVVTAWALAIRAEGLTPLYSTDWTNQASLALARSLGLEIYAADWSIGD